MNDLSRIMTTPIYGVANNGKPIVNHSVSGNAAKWLRKHKQTNNGKSYEKI